MAYQCPTCGGPAERGSGRVAQQAAGLVGLLVHAAFAGYSCAKCGKIAKAQFPPEVQATMTRNSILLVLGAVALLGLVVVVLVALN